jgi:hypothetical protein
MEIPSLAVPTATLFDNKVLGDKTPSMVGTCLGRINIT